MTYSQKILKDFQDAIEQFEKVLHEKSKKQVVQAGCIQYFEFCFELAWKAVKVFAELQGLEAVGSPKACLKQAFALEWINHEKIWIEMLEARNRMSHTYCSDDALVVYKDLPKYLPELKSLHAALRLIRE